MVLLDLHLELRKAVKSPLQDEAAFSEIWHFYYSKSSFSNDDSKRLENHFTKREEVFVPNMSKNNKLSHFSYRYFILGESNPSLRPNFRISEFPVLHMFLKSRSQEN